MNWLKTIPVAVCMIAFVAPSFTYGQVVPETVLISSEVLTRTKARIAKRDPKLVPAMKQLIKDADAALGSGPYSVTDA